MYESCILNNPLIRFGISWLFASKLHPVDKDISEITKDHQKENQEKADMWKRLSE